MDIKIPVYDLRSYAGRKIQSYREQSGTTRAASPIKQKFHNRPFDPKLSLLATLLTSVCHWNGCIITHKYRKVNPTYGRCR